MGPKIQQVGGGPATGLAENFINFLQSGINTGSFGGVTAGQQAGAANPMQNTMGMAGVLNDILAGGGGQLGGALHQMISSDIERQANNLRARFGTGGGTAFGSPAAFAESQFRAEAAPQATAAIGNMQMQALGQLLPIFAGLSSKGISQRETIATPSTLSQIAQIAAPIAGAAINPTSLATSIPSMFSRGGGANNLIVPGANTGQPNFGSSAGAMNFFGMNRPQLPLFPIARF